jgi:hypothetical protein
MVTPQSDTFKTWKNSAFVMRGSAVRFRPPAPCINESSHLLAVDTMAAALEIAKACPILAHGAQIEVRPIADLCRPMADVKAANS